MARHIPRPVPYRRVREHRTNYRKRRLLILSQKPRVVVRFTNRRVIGQVVIFTPKGDKVLTATDSFALKKIGWTLSGKNTSAAYLVGILLARKTQSIHLKEAILDVGFRTPAKKSKLYAFLKGVLDGGLHLPHGQEIFPDQERLAGKHLLSQDLKSKDQHQQKEENALFEQVKKQLLALPKK